MAAHVTDCTRTTQANSPCNAAMPPVIPALRQYDGVGCMPRPVVSRLRGNDGDEVLGVTALLSPHLWIADQVRNDGVVVSALWILP